MYCGKSIVAFSNEKTIVVNVVDFVSGTGVQMHFSRGRLEEKLASAELTEFRSSIGCLQWCTSTCRPDMAADTSLLQKGASELQLKDLAEAQRVITCLKSTPENGFVISAINLDNPLVGSYSDASWCNAPGFRTQAGYLIVMTDQGALQRTRPAAVLESKSRRLKRSVKPTLAAEAAAMESACDVDFYIGVFLSELLQAQFRDHDRMGTPSWLCVLSPTVVASTTRSSSS